MAAPRTPKSAAGVTPSAAEVGYGEPGAPPSNAQLLAAVIQLQNTLNALIVRFNAHQHAALNAAPGGAFLHDATPQAAANLFTSS